MKEHGRVLKTDDGKFYNVDEDDFVDDLEEGCFFLFKEDAEDFQRVLLEDGIKVKLVPATWDDGYVKEGEE